MTYNPEKHRRRSIRLKGYDYTTPGAYFVTIVAHKRECLFGKIMDDKMVLNEYGKIIEQTWHGLPNHYNNVQLDEFIIMPNHVHCIIILTDDEHANVGAGFKPAPTMNKPLSEIIRAFKTFSARRINKLRDVHGISVWQRNYYDHIVRDENDLNRIRTYIINNTLQWDSDDENPEKVKLDNI